MMFVSLVQSTIQSFASCISTVEKILISRGRRNLKNLIEFRIPPISVTTAFLPLAVR